MKFLIALGVCAVAAVGCNSGSSTTGNFTLKGAGSSSSSVVIKSASDPSSLNLKIYKFAVSTNADCSSPTTVYTNDNPDYTNFLNTPTIGSGTLADGTYPCVIIEMSDFITFQTTTTDGPCAADTTYTLDVCRQMGSTTQTSTLIDGSTVTCTGTNSTTGEDRVAIYISTLSTATGGGEGSNPFTSPTTTTTTNGIRLGSALTVSGTAIGTFGVDGTGQVNNGGDTENCDMQPPAFTFTSTD